MYAIAFDLDTERLRQLYPDSTRNNAYFDIRGKLEARGFRWQQESVYFGNDDIRATDCVKATMDLDALFPWFRPSVRDIRMMQITEEDTLMDFLGYEAGLSCFCGRTVLDERHRRRLGRHEMVFARAGTRHGAASVARRLHDHRAAEAESHLATYFARLVLALELSVRTLNLAIELDHSVYDCACLACALPEGGPLVSADEIFLNKADRAGYSTSVLRLEQVVSKPSLGNP